MEDNKIYLGDAYDLIKDVPDGSVDLVYTDIPYDMAYDKQTLMRNDGYKQSKTKAECKKMLNPIINGIDYSIFREMIRVCKKPNIYVWCSFNQIFKIKEVCDSCVSGLTYKMLVWWKNNALMMNKNQWVSDCEYCLVITKGNGVKNPESLRTPKLFQSGTNTKENAEYGHPTTKPFDMVTEHIRIITEEGDLVLDPFAGSGTTCCAAKSLNRRYIGFEVDENYYENSVRRLNGEAVGSANAGYVQESLF